jgi:hypothetical protein
MLRQTFVLHPVGSVGHLVHCIVSSTQNINALFFMLGWNWFGFHKNHEGTCSRKNTIGRVTPNMHFCIRWDLQVT